MKNAVLHKKKGIFCDEIAFSCDKSSSLYDLDDYRKQYFFCRK